MKHNVKPIFIRRKKVSLAAAFMLAGMVCPTLVFAANAGSLAASYVSSNYQTNNVSDGSAFSVYLDGSEVTNQFTGDSEIKVTTEGRTLLPVRALGNLLGCNVDWDGTSKVAVLTLGSTTLEVPIGSGYLIVDGSSVQSIDAEGTKAIIYEERTYMPFRAVCENFGFSVSYDAATKSIYITSSGTTGEVTPAPSTEPVPSDPKLAALGIYNATDLGFSTSNMPSPGEDYYDSITNYVSIYRSEGLTDEQIDANLQYVYPCKANGDGSGTATTAQEEHFDTVGLTATRVNEPTWKGEYKYQQYYGYMWNGSSWTECASELTGTLGVSFSMS